MKNIGDKKRVQLIRPKKTTTKEVVVEPKIFKDRLLVFVQKFNKVKNDKRFLLAVVTGLLILVLSGIYFFANDINLLAGNKGKINNNIIARVSKLVVINDSTGVMLATVTDKNKLKNQRFFNNAENGDYVVFFPAERKAVLYRSSVNKIVEIAPILDNQSKIQ